MSARDVVDEHALARPLSVADLSAFVDQGVPAPALSRGPCGTIAMIARDRVVMSGDRFEFERNQRGGRGIACFSLIVLDGCGEPADILAFRPGGPTALWLGRVATVGEEQIRAPRIDLGDALDVHADVLAWLRAGRHGIVVLDHRRAAALLEETTLRANTAKHARELHSKLTRPAPRILVAEPAEQRKARTA